MPSSEPAARRSGPPGGTGARFVVRLGTGDQRRPEHRRPDQCSQGQGGDQPNTAPKSGSDGQSDEKSKDEPTPPAYKLLRYEEDYSYLKDPSRRTDFWDPIKYIPLWGRDDWYLSLGGEVRERYEFYHNQDAGAVARQRAGQQRRPARTLLCCTRTSTSAPTSASSDKS